MKHKASGKKNIENRSFLTLQLRKSSIVSLTSRKEGREEEREGKETTTSIIQGKK